MSSATEGLAHNQDRRPLPKFSRVVRQKTITVPANTVSMRVDGPHVAVVNDQNQILLQRVRLGRDLGKRVVVADGIRGDERLVVNPGDDLTNGFRIQIREPGQTNEEVAQH